MLIEKSPVAPYYWLAAPAPAQTHTVLPSLQLQYRVVVVAKIDSSSFISQKFFSTCTGTAVEYFRNTTLHHRYRLKRFASFGQILCNTSYCVYYTCMYNIDVCYTATTTVCITASTTEDEYFRHLYFFSVEVASCSLRCHQLIQQSKDCDLVASHM